MYLSRSSLARQWALQYGMRLKRMRVRANRWHENSLSSKLLTTAMYAWCHHTIMIQDGPSYKISSMLQMRESERVYTDMWLKGGIVSRMNRAMRVVEDVIRRPTFTSSTAAHVLRCSTKYETRWTWVYLPSWMIYFDTHCIMKKINHYLQIRRHGVADCSYGEVLAAYSFFGGVKKMHFRQVCDTNDQMSASSIQ